MTSRSCSRPSAAEYPDVRAPPPPPRASAARAPSLPVSLPPSLAPCADQPSLCRSDGSGSEIGIGSGLGVATAAATPDNVQRGRGRRIHLRERRLTPTHRHGEDPPSLPSVALPTSPLPPRWNIRDRAGSPTPMAPPPLRLGAALPLTRLLPSPGRPRPPAGERFFGLRSRLSLAAGASSALLRRPRNPAGSLPPPSTALAALVGLGPSLPQHPLTSPHPALSAVRGFASPGLHLVCSTEAPSSPGAVSKQNSGNFGSAAVRGLFRSSAGFSPRPRCSSSSAVLLVCGPESCNARSLMDWIMCAVAGLGQKADSAPTVGARGWRRRECHVSRCVCVCARESFCFFSHDGFKLPFFCRKVNLESSMESCSILRRH